MAKKLSVLMSNLDWSRDELFLVFDLYLLILSAH